MDGELTLAQYRERRAQRAAQLREQGLSTRAIAGRLGVTHPTVLADLAVEQLDREQLPGMSPAQVNAARKAGKLANLMGEQTEGDAA